MYVKRKIEAHLCNHHCRGGEKKIHILSVFVAIGIQHAIFVRHIFICGLSGSKYFSTLSHKRHEFRKKKESYLT